ncbi:MAG: hypothetical protein CO156_01025 [Candidatus Pacebacteria bacterium CG_4_9_14_3_um_filter_40_12]|nr:hypothetical protein [Candidatus Paceibacterota bacterium]PIR63810.1 MAG: hypothetical protein COU64_02460 [Candidatus Pacebacteria bacterium CG10_big_fil_rev_8_21_14_0_10_40_26]PIZ78597.1 MAG: hypothetical protein COY01_05135 [Candidatus Pacebacteria bacterium CG_4_10_14_0_2_um_filter_40_20]PJA69448.1 MAG: hypothetical protein CO156_01025 [Candidatus Pacebacteria bacterium CG_4_9_14_3_um_filter_40_12]PJC41465.1 MAG: hypothetical protein CO041_05010 [Candidatus Pacebacteria bacterium CG_4_9_
MYKKFLKELITFVDTKFLFIATGFLIAFIPLYPKLPLLDILPGYIVRLRLEDVLIFITLLIWSIQLYRKKISIKSPLSKPIFTYLGFATLSVLSAMFITKTVPLHAVHVEKTILHLLRNVEYFSLFFITLTAIRSKKDVAFFFKVLIAAFVCVALYGLGQKYLYWPVYSTMNREFSKGIRLYLTEHARVQSTFGGHYDLAAYIVILLPLILSATFVATKRYLKIGLWVTFTLGVWLLVVSAARTSFVATLFALGLVILLATIKQQKSKFKFIMTQSAIVALIVSTIFVRFGDDISDRLLDALEGYPSLNTAYHQSNATRKYYLYEYIPEKLGLRDALNTIKIQAPSDGMSTDELDAALIASDQQPVTQKPSDVYVDVPDLVKVATISATGKSEIILIEQPRTYSDNALKYGLSMAIRLDTLWPQAWKGFTTNPLLGTGYATLTKSSVYEFTEADSTDNNFLRVLGELGLLGFIAFFGTLLLALKYAKNMYSNFKADDLETVLAIGYIAGTIGLLINALFIDVFVSSKVAFTFWILTGMIISLSPVLSKKNTNAPIEKASKPKKTTKKKRTFS